MAPAGLAGACKSSEQRAAAKVVDTLVSVLSPFNRLLNWLECLTAPRGDVVRPRTTHCP